MTRCKTGARRCVTRHYTLAVRLGLDDKDVKLYERLRHTRTKHFGTKVATINSDVNGHLGGNQWPKTPRTYRRMSRYSLPLFANRKLPIYAMAVVKPGNSWACFFALAAFTSLTRTCAFKYLLETTAHIPGTLDAEMPSHLSWYPEMLPHDAQLQQESNSFDPSPVPLTFTARATFPLRCAPMLARSGVKYEACNGGGRRRLLGLFGSIMVDKFVGGGERQSWFDICQ